MEPKPRPGVDTISSVWARSCRRIQKIPQKAKSMALDGENINKHVVKIHEETPGPFEASSKENRRRCRVLRIEGGLRGEETLTAASDP